MSGPANVVLSVIVFLLAGPQSTFGEKQSYSDLTTPPADSAEAERVRIWIPLERQGRCRLTVDILGDSNKVIRHLVNRLLSTGYYNFYWDKRDDSGGYVSPGRYLFRADNCGQKSYGEVFARFKKWETVSRLYPPSERWSSEIGFELSEDSGLVSLRLYNRRGKLVDEPIVDSLMHRGIYEFKWSPPPEVPRGLYTVKLTIGDFTHVIEIGYEP